MTKHVTNAMLAKQLAAHDKWEKTHVLNADKEYLGRYDAAGAERSQLAQIIDKMDARTSKVEEHIIVLNKEMGDVQGQLGWIKWLMVGTLGTGLANLGWMIFGK